jgi:regulator of nucleoside diphosphate kinase
MCYTLVFPGEETPGQGKLSVLSPMGMALLGARVGEEVAWMSAAGPEVAVVKNVLYQPEAAGHYHL